MRGAARPALAAALLLLAGAAGATEDSSAAPEPSPRVWEDVWFDDAAIFFAPDSTAGFANPAYRVAENGRVALTTTPLFYSLDPVPRRRELRIVVRPVPLDERSVHDRWDRAGNLRLVMPGGPDLELARFMTAYGGRTEWTFDVTAFSPLLHGRSEAALFIDTWVHPA